MNTTTQKIAAKCWAIVPAAGQGSRMQSSRPKQYLPLQGRLMIEHSLSRLLETDWITGIVVALAEDDQYWQTLDLSNEPRIKTVTGGKERVDSVSNALAVIQEQLQDNDLILIHDAARPCIGKDDLEKLYQIGCNTDSGAVLADKLTDTIKRDDGNCAVLKTVPRDGLWRALTPQIFPRAVLVKALSQAKNTPSALVTDEASAVEALGVSPKLIQGRSDNIKVTRAEDMQLASLILQAQSRDHQCE